MSLAPPGANPPRAAFTLLELLAVIAIGAVLAGIVLGAGRRATTSGRTARAQAELGVAAAALDAYRRTYGDFPQTEDSDRLLQALLGRRGPTNAAVTGQCLLEIARFTTADGLDPLTNAAARLVDPWGEPYRYAYKTQAPWSNPGYVLYSTGPDRSDSPALLTGGFPDTSAPLNADNIHANPR